MENKPINRIKVMLAERMISNKELAGMLGDQGDARRAHDIQQRAGRNARQRPCNNIQVGDQYIPA